ncbi:MAG: dihydrodipicolinate synthase family protein [Planctomycetaceae bacterium]|nr:dihydrodipicolinate synthase family protein [Planctomycetaceae bacterium]
MTQKRYPSCLMSTCCIPWNEDFQFDEERFRKGVRTALSGTQHLYLFGTAGEGYAVTDRQFDLIVGAFVEEMREAGAEPMIGVIHLSLGTIIERIERCRENGVRQFQISLPSWGALTEPELFSYFDAVCGRFSDCVFMHYNLPRVKRLVTGAEYGRLAEAYPNLVATKNTGDSLSHIYSLQTDAPQLQHFLSEAGYVYGSLFGECGILASFVTNWSKLRTLLDAGKQRDIMTIVSLQQEFNILIEILFEAIPGDRIDGAYDKLFAKMYDPTFPLRMQPPYTGSSDEEFASFLQLLRKRLPEWVPATN